MSLTKLLDLTNKVAIITGGSRGLGLQLAQGLGEMGASIVLIARKPTELKSAQRDLQANHIKTLTISCDMSEQDTAKTIVDQVLDECGTIDILVNNAGTNWAAPAEDYPASSWRKVMNLNMDAVFFLTQEVARRAMIPQRSGKIINIASVSGVGGNPPQQQANTIAYNTSKGALVNFTKALAVEWGKYNININAICPGFFYSKMSSGLISQIEDQLLSDTPLGRLPSEEDFKGICAFLASEASRHITGQIVTVDGGATSY